MQDLLRHRGPSEKTLLLENQGGSASVICGVGFAQANNSLTYNFGNNENGENNVEEKRPFFGRLVLGSAYEAFRMVTPVLMMVQGLDEPDMTDQENRTDSVGKFHPPAKTSKPFLHLKRHIV